MYRQICLNQTIDFGFNYILRFRFHAFLKGRQTKPECGRQTLQELLIRPVQRLPSISLLLDGLYYFFFIQNILNTNRFNIFMLF